MTDIDLASIQRRLMSIFHPYAMDKISDVQENNTRFVHYTSASAAMKILKTEKFWMRKTSCMNDFMEVQYGLDCLNKAYHGKEWKKLRKILNSINGGVLHEIDDLFENLLPYLQTNTYIACFSEHLKEENKHGRLSMWRAYSESTGVALVVNNTLFLGKPLPLGIYTSPVAYLGDEDFQIEFQKVVNNIMEERNFLQKLDRKELILNVFNAFMFAALCTKHPGFIEENEWRAIYIPTMTESEHLEKDIEVIRGTPQPVHKIHLKNVPDKGLVGLEIPDILDRIIIGPTEYPVAIQEAFVTLLADAGVEDPVSRVWVSGIPLRH